jgi:broad specificity phosphatase PhoE
MRQAGRFTDAISPNKFLLAPAAEALHAAAMTRFLTIVAALILPAAAFATEWTDDGFFPIFDGTMKDWDGDPVYWRIENGSLIGEVRPDTLLKRNTFIKKMVRKENWNEAHIVAHGNLLQHFTNGVLMSEVRDEDPEKRSLKGLLGVQVHTGPPMRIEFRNIRLKRLTVEATASPAK